MLRMGKLTDYGIVLMSYLAANRGSQHSAHTLSDAVQMPLPTVRKVLKHLCAAGLLNSERGAQGGYALSRQPELISVAEIITAIEGPIALTECVSSESHCDQETHCAVQTNWTRINNAVFHALDEVKLSHMLTLPASASRPLVFYPAADKLNKINLNDGEVHD
ncbi:Iron-sulfur cluster regulator IscR [Methylophaga lonarensis MPL]|uniref:Iron-sulfur cluster regulator IscR n=1 Tax=Methylophaga lonarensis MPL TaxID=1286106 RepID=M7PF00_9GAMM|nr:SUF system Fe-S cluster assembly regulator [Methylophaga lonarensis]EMR12475.1 Iron-sulfur cluster regulator IscR [Methylophaga lonarensis MPL]